LVSPFGSLRYQMAYVERVLLRLFLCAQRVGGTWLAFGCDGPLSLFCTLLGLQLACLVFSFSSDLHQRVVRIGLTFTPSSHPPLPPTGKGVFKSALSVSWSVPGGFSNPTQTHSAVALFRLFEIPGGESSLQLLKASPLQPNI